VAMPGLRTSDGLSESVRAGQVAWSIAMFGAIYALLFAVWIFVLDRKIRQGPDEEDDAGTPADRGVLASAAALAGSSRSLLDPGDRRKGR
jgi:cytochrome bd-type quinol oxidase subunit 1